MSAPASIPPAAAAEASYNEQEQLVWETLSGLVRDAAWLKSYVAATLLAVKETLQVRLVLGGWRLAVGGSWLWGRCREGLPGGWLQPGRAPLAPDLDYGWAAGTPPRPAHRTGVMPLLGVTSDRGSSTGPALQVAGPCMHPCQPATCGRLPHILN